MIDDVVEIIYVVLRIDLVIGVSSVAREDPAVRAGLVVAIRVVLRTYCVKSSSTTRAVLTV